MPRYRYDEPPTRAPEPTVPPGLGGDVLPRLTGIDLARGLAVLGMIVVHTGMFAVSPDVNALFSGRSSILFAVLAGVSLALLSGGQRIHVGTRLRRDRVSIAVRGGMLLVLGMLLAVVPSHVLVILITYAVLFLLALPVLAWSWRRLAGTALAWALVAPVISFVLRGAILPETDTLGGTLTALDLLDPGSLVAGLRMTFIDGTYPVLTWVPFLLLGLALGRWGLDRRDAGWKLFLAGAALATIGYGGSALALTAGARDALIAAMEETSPGMGAGMLDELARTGFPGAVYATDWRWLLVDDPHSGTSFEIVGSGGVAVLLIGASLLVARWLPRVVAPIAAVGRMPLTIYVGHILAIGLLMVLGVLTLDMTQFALFLIVPVVVAVAWSRWAGRGPLERMMTAGSRAIAGRITDNR
ncbi:DUF1624 domain-containing protein [Hoyosella sp. G463]|uniref:DUF1624 domain-containing protein n=1 Tax=Lolliginicoccus lacisalsi TaxID=2742202 RepID=A0A927PLN8_9ACTN|nr:heparan-alpha-glucosaminide N-acetyltransferase domain-containing protein [Lolliginicoccus lacisalsi]MBD8507048.1 DUF1624 domain-containing protein [Lolliginicoccus lacisalsi]